MLTASQEAKILDLESYLVRISHNLVRTHYPEQDPDDLLQVMNLYILERAETEPEFLSQRPGYVSRAAAWAARAYCSPKRTGVNHGADRVAFSLDDPNDEGVENAERFAAPSGDLDIAIAVRDALKDLTGLTAKVASLMLAGLSISEVGRELGLSRQTIHYHKVKPTEILAPIYTEARG